MKRLSGSAMVAGVVGRPIAHSLSPAIHNAWIEAAALDAAYVPFAPTEDGFERLVRGFRGGAVRGLNITAPFKERALELADEADETARRCGSANVLLFHDDGTTEARSTDGAGLLGAFAEQAPAVDLSARPAVVLGAGGAAKAAVWALIGAGAPQIFVLNRTANRAEELVFSFGAPSLSAHALNEAERLFALSGVVINAAIGGPSPPIDALPEGAVVMDMTYRPVETALLKTARAHRLATVDGLAMLIQQAIPSFEAFFGHAPPASVDVRKKALAALKARP